MTNTTLAQSYLIKARKRLRVLDVLMEDFWSITGKGFPKR